MPSAAWPFVALAVALAAWWLASRVPTWPLELRLDWQLQLAVAGLGPVVGAGLPAALLWAAPDVWWSDRTPLIGVIVWTTPAALVTLATAAIAHEPGGTPADVLGAAAAVAALLGYAGPLILLVGLGRRRVTEASWPPALIVISTAAVIALVARALSDVTEQLSSYPATASPGMQSLLVVDALRPVTVLTFGALAWMALSALRAREQPRQFWALLGSASAAGIAAYLPLAAMTAAPSRWLAEVLASTPITLALALATAAEWLLFLFAFLVGIPEYVAGEEDDEGAGTDPVGGKARPPIEPGRRARGIAPDARATRSGGS